MNAVTAAVGSLDIHLSKNVISSSVAALTQLSFSNPAFHAPYGLGGGSGTAPQLATTTIEGRAKRYRLPAKT